MLLSKANLMVAKVASENHKDYGLNAVRINADGSTVATNQDVFGIVSPLPQTRFSFPALDKIPVSPPATGVSIPLHLVKDIIKSLPKDKRPQMQLVQMLQATHPTIESEFATLKEEGGIKTTSGLNKQEGFPPWKEIASNLRQNVVTRVCVKRKSLKQLLEFIEAACPDVGEEDAVYIEITNGPNGQGMVLRAMNRKTEQRVIGLCVPFKWQPLPTDTWEREVFGISIAKRIQK